MDEMQFMFILALMGLLIIVSLFFFNALIKEVRADREERRIEKEKPKIMKVKLNGNAVLPKRAHPTDAGFDLCTPAKVYLDSHGSAIIDTGVCVELPEGTYGVVASKSGLFFKDNIFTTGTVDEGYRGSIKVKLVNLSGEPKKFEKGNKIAQLIIVPYERPLVSEVDKLSETDRGEGGFGSTGA